MVDRARRTDSGIIIVLALIAALLLFRAFFSAPGKGGASSGTAAESVTYEDYNGRNIGILTGTNMEQESCSQKTKIPAEPCGEEESWQRESDPRPPHYQCDALPTVLCQQSWSSRDDRETSYHTVRHIVNEKKDKR